MPESIDGLDDCYIRYDLLATIDFSWGVIPKSKIMNVIRRPDFLSFIESEVSPSPFPMIRYKTDGDAGHRTIMAR